MHSLSKIILNDGIVPLDAEEGDAVEDQILTLRDFGNEVKPLVRKVSIWAAKSAATFHEALDCFLGFDEEVRYFPNEIVRRRMKSRILKTHAFDRGDQGHLELLESARSNILKNLRDPYMPERPGETKPYTQLDSAFSYPVQAADIAAGIASKLLETQSLVTVVSAFEYVTYNGQRISVADAEEELRRMVP